MNPIVSVIVPTYNHAHYLPSALTTIQAQRFHHWEAIVVDDGSTDDPAAVVAELAHPRIRYIRQENQGVSAARNTGIRAACGDYLAFLDADDEWEAEFLQRSLDILTADSTLTATYTRYRFIAQDGHLLPQLGGQVVPPADLRSRLLEGGFFPPHAVLVRAAAVRQAGLFDTRLSGLADWDLWLRVADQGPMQGIPEPLVRYRVCPGSMSTNASAMHADRMRILAGRFGPPEGSPSAWPAEKRRAYGFAYRASALDHLQQGQAEEVWPLLAQAVAFWPALLNRPDTFYELACGDQPKGFRGQARSLDIAGNGAAMLNGLDSLFARDNPDLNGLHANAYGHAYLALVMLSDQAGQWAAARRYLVQAIRAQPRLLVSYPVIRRFLKLWAGQRLAGIARTTSHRR